MSDNVCKKIRTRNSQLEDPMKPVQWQDTQRMTPGSREHTSISATNRRWIYADLGIAEGPPEMGAPRRFIMCMRRRRSRCGGSRRTRVSWAAIYMHLWSGACDARGIRLVLSRSGGYI